MVTVVPPRAGPDCAAGPGPLLRCRVHVLTSPISPYLRYECEWGYAPNVFARLQDIASTGPAARAALTRIARGLPEPLSRPTSERQYGINPSLTGRFPALALTGRAGASAAGGDLLPRWSNRPKPVAPGLGQGERIE
jgi:hypothetical protein